MYKISAAQRQKGKCNHAKWRVTLSKYILNSFICCAVYTLTFNNASNQPSNRIAIWARECRMKSTERAGHTEQQEHSRFVHHTLTLCLCVVFVCASLLSETNFWSGHSTSPHGNWISLMMTLSLKGIWSICGCSCNGNKEKDHQRIDFMFTGRANNAKRIVDRHKKEKEIDRDNSERTKTANIPPIGFCFFHYEKPSCDMD